LKRHSPAARAILAVAAVALLFDAAIVALPALADNRGASPSPTPIVAALEVEASASVAGPTVPIYDPTESPTPPPTPSPTAVPTPTPRPTPKPTPRDTVWNARIWLKAQIGATQYNCIYQIFERESKWNTYAGNPSSGAYGIPQAFPGSKMATFGSNWRYSPLTQVKWGLWYVNQRYGSACQAWAFWQAHGWY
jgi:hypothetical protein